MGNPFGSTSDAASITHLSILKNDVPVQAPSIVNELKEVEPVYFAVCYTDKNTEILTWTLEKIATWNPGWAPKTIISDMGENFAPSCRSPSCSPRPLTSLLCYKD